MNPESHQSKIITAEAIPRSPDDPNREVLLSRITAELQSQYAIGEQVTVERNGKNGAPNSYEDGWVVSGYNPESAKVIVSSPDGVYEKELRTERLDEIKLLREAQEDLGKEAVEEVIQAVDVAPQAASRILGIEQKEEVSDPYDYLRTALPVVTRPKRAEPAINYDKLFRNTQDVPLQPLGQEQRYGHYEAPKDTPEDKQRKYYDKYVTAQNRANAEHVLVQTITTTPEIGEILTRYNLQPTLDAVDAIRENPDVRFEVAKLLAQKLDALASNLGNDMGSRINRNDENNLKADPITGKKMPSRLYAVDMALKMIGGEYSARQASGDSIDRDAKGVVVLGQHRHAATSILLSK